MTKLAIFNKELADDYEEQTWKERLYTTQEGEVIKEAFWRVVLELVIKEKWDLKNHQIPSDRAFQNFAKPKAQLLYRILELAIQCHSFATKEYRGNPPKHACCWFGFIFMEFKALDLASVYNGQIDQETRSPYSAGKHLWHLTNIAKALAAVSPQFEDDFWQPFVEAQKADVNLSGLDTSKLTPVWTEKNGLYTSLHGEGKGKHLIWRF